MFSCVLRQRVAGRVEGVQVFWGLELRLQTVGNIDCRALRGSAHRAWG